METIQHEMDSIPRRNEPCQKKAKKCKTTKSHGKMKGAWQERG
jgi:hypothetical protein